MSIQAQFASIAREGGRAALVTAVRGPHAGERMLVHVDGATEGTLGDAELDAQARAHVEDLIWTERSELRDDLFVDVSAPPPRLVIFGAVEFAVYLSSYAKIAGWRAYVVDPRARFATPERFPDAVDVVAGWPDAAFEKLGAIDPATYLTVLTHDPKLDDAVLLMALKSEPAYIGAMGSKRAQKERRERLMAHGVTDDELARISAPVGLDLGATGAQETALSIMAECVAVRYGRDGGRLCEKGSDRKRIHAEAAS
jgi:xanthine dehydrogenase accessory factor